jgi:hypothetical protein
MFNFKMRHWFTSKAFHDKRRPWPTMAQEAHWRNRIEGLFQTVAHDHVLNTDETSWLLRSWNILPWMGGNSDYPPVLIQGGEKENLTALATVTAASGHLPLFFLTRGKTERAERSQIGKLIQDWVSHSPSGWMMEEAFEQYLGLLRHRYPDGSEPYLLPGCCSAHWT